MPKVSNEDFNREQLAGDLKKEFDLTVEETIDEFTDEHKLRIYGKTGKRYKRKGPMRSVLVFINTHILNRLDEFCHDNSLSRSAFIKLSIYKFCRELGIAQEYESEYDRAVREQAVDDINKQDPEPGNPYGSPWTTDEGAPS